MGSHRKTVAVMVPVEVFNELTAERVQSLAQAVASVRAERLTVGVGVQAIIERPRQPAGIVIDNYVGRLQSPEAPQCGAMWEHDGVVQRRFLLSRSVNAGLLALLLLLGAVVGPLSMWMLERHTLATSPKVDHYFVEGCAWQTNIVIFVPWGLVALVIVAFLLEARSRTVGILLTSLAVGWQVPMVWLIFDLGVGWCGDPDGASLVRDATPGWLGPVWLAWLVLGVALGVSHVIALIRFPVSPQQPAVRIR